MEKIELVCSPAAVYNFEVDKLHSYYVAGSQVLVHNECADSNRLHHLFDNPDQNLGPLVKKFGDLSEAYDAVYGAFKKVAHNFTPEQLIKGVVVMVDGIDVTVKGAIHNGVVQIGIFFIK